MRFTAALLLVGTLWGTLCATVRAQGQPSPGRAFANGPPADPSFFPIGVWLQSPHNAKAYRELGINLYVGLYGGPTEAQLEALEQAEMPVILTRVSSWRWP